ncbi:hypothetical protein [Paenibacillus odorifer]|uniref:Uncharacterized protein n=1 Tax=Paenibacillus odorifer TaxID=189426 RepID=A0A1R0Y1C2_9BACL|nr:hypothetical protein [Paenibacillus odorifer]OMD41077.1 hypothetical protein BSK52_11620 [Paenibacillus odorifer]
MNKICTRKVLTLMLLVSMFSFMGCGSESKDEKAAKKILSSLHEKYGEEFVLDGIGGGWGTMNNNTLKAMVYPKKDETLRFPVEITKDLKKVYDKYLNQVVARNEEPHIQEMAASIWPDSKVIVANETGLVYPEHSDTKISYEQFLKLYPTNTQVVTVYLNCDNYMDNKGNADRDKEIEAQLAFVKRLEENKYVSSLITIAYLTPDAHSRLDDIKKTESDVDLYYSDETKETGIVNIVTMVGYSLGADGEIEESREEIEEYYEIWKEKRMESFEQRGGL